MSACEGALLIVDATQGVEAQTLANAWLAIEADLEIIPVLNKVDFPSADIEKVKLQIKELIGIETNDTVSVSAKTGQGVKQLLDKIILKCPHPIGSDNDPLKALLIDSWYDSYLGVMVLIRVKSGYLKKNMKIKLLVSDTEYQIEKVGVLHQSHLR